MSSAKSRITVIICDHQARDLPCVDTAMILNNGKIVAQDTPSNLVNNINAKTHILVTTLSSINFKCQKLLK